jgi:hypothetical protein
LTTGISNTPPPPEPRPIGAELAFCERYLVDYNNAFVGFSILLHRRAAAYCIDGASPGMLVAYRIAR